MGADFGDRSAFRYGFIFPFPRKIRKRQDGAVSMYASGAAAVFMGTRHVQPAVRLLLERI